MTHSSLSNNKSSTNVRKQIRFASTVSTNDAASVTRACLAQEATLTPDGGRERFWYTSTDFDRFSRYNKDLVAYATAAGPISDKDWTQLEYALNIHGHSLRGCEKISSMPGRNKRDDKKDMAIYGVLEALKVYKGDDEQVARIAQRLSTYSVKCALELGDLDELAVICFPAEHELRDNRVQNVNKAQQSPNASDTEDETDDDDDEYDNYGRAVKKTRRRSKGSIRKDLLNALKMIRSTGGGKQ